MLLFLSHILKRNTFWGTLKAGSSVQKNACGTFFSILLPKSALLPLQLPSAYVSQLPSLPGDARGSSETPHTKKHFWSLSFPSVSIQIIRARGKRKIKKKKEEMLLFLLSRCWSMLSARCSAGGPRRLAAPGEQRADACLKYCPLWWQLGRERREAGASCSSPSPLVVAMTSPEKSWQRAGKEPLAAATQGGEPIVEEEVVEGREGGEDKGGEDVPAAARERDALPPQPPPAPGERGRRRPAEELLRVQTFLWGSSITPVWILPQFLKMTKIWGSQTPLLPRPSPHGSSFF